jgi:hypothetical protein
VSVGATEDITIQARAALDLAVSRGRRGRWVLQVGDETRQCHDRDLPDALRQALGLTWEDALALAEAVRAGER